MGRSRKKNEDGFTESQLENLESAYFIITQCLPGLAKLKKSNLKKFKNVLGSLRSQIFDNSFFKTGLKSDAAIELEKKLNSMEKTERDFLKKNDDNYKFTDEHVVNRVVISCLLIYLMMIGVIITFEQFVEFLRKYNITVKITKKEHKRLNDTTGYYVKILEDYLGRNISIFGIEKVFGNMDIELLKKAISELELIEE